MDPETTRVVFTGLFALGGAAIGGLIAYRNALVGIEGQRRIARDNAIRQHRLDQLRPLRDRANHRLAAYSQMVHAVEGLPLSDPGLFGQTSDDERRKQYAGNQRKRRVHQRRRSLQLEFHQ